MSIKRTLTLLLPLIILAIIAVAIFLLLAFKPKAKQAPPKVKANLIVATKTIEPQTFTVQIESFGRITAPIQTDLQPQVSGKIVYISDTLDSGQEISKGETLLSIEKIDYEINLIQAQAIHIDAQRQLDEETARAEQAKKDWALSGKKGTPAPLVLRKPQIAAATAQLKSAQAGLERAKLNLTRTDIKAPYDGRVILRNINLYQTVTPNSVIGRIFSTDALEVTLPIKNSDLPLLDVSNLANSEKAPQVNITSTHANPIKKSAVLARISANIDEQTRQPFVVALLKNPFTKEGSRTSDFKIGQYVKAYITGKTLQNAIVIENKAIYQGSYVYVYKEDRIYRRDISIRWQNNKLAIIENGLLANEQIVISPLGRVSSGTLVQNESNAQPSRKKPKEKQL